MITRRIGASRACCVWSVGAMVRPNSVRVPQPIPVIDGMDSSSFFGRVLSRICSDDRLLGCCVQHAAERRHRGRRSSQLFGKCTVHVFFYQRAVRYILRTKYLQRLDTRVASAVLVPVNNTPCSFARICFFHRCAFLFRRIEPQCLLLLLLPTPRFFEARFSPPNVVVQGGRDAAETPVSDLFLSLTFC